MWQGRKGWARQGWAGQGWAGLGKAGLGWAFCVSAWRSDQTRPVGGLPILLRT
ncbi:hypothetical protein K505DRAFT_323138 [Melanomma pulvis-pyrius CBS 109.77]|uniref:Uncharacterized protein n=1 Tax=Melanomma pulvis-pyrius CBS 109.77 TaxID=1314802 RepID=A0A6A6XK73_9PLEO|nr:hypothetical protein K505DRAFT_323138 [Melanomma pulvis-pyrius CBS 109.77]